MRDPHWARREGSDLAVESREQHEQEAAAWLIRQDGGAWTAQDAAEFDAWLAASAGHRVAYYRFKGAWQEAGKLGAVLGARPNLLDEASPVDEVLEAPAPSRRRRRVPGAALAAGVACALSLAVMAYLLLPLPSNVYSTRIGVMETVSLPDGSRLTLNTDSRLRVDLDQQERHVGLRQGEAFFEVAKDPARPFVVEAGDKRVIAVGTAFSVRRSGDDVQVVVSEGRVRVETRGGKTEELAAPLLKAGMMARTQGAAVLVQERSPEQIAQTLSWRNGQLVFRDTPMAEAVAEFNRYNERKLIIDDPAVGQLRVGGIFRATQLDAFVSLVQQGFPVQAQREADRIVLTSRN